MTLEEWNALKPFLREQIEQLAEAHLREHGARGIAWFDSSAETASPETPGMPAI